LRTAHIPQSYPGTDIVTIREYLQRENPDLTIITTTTQSTGNVHWEPIEGFKPFAEFTWNTFEALYTNVLDHKLDAEKLPIPNKLLRIKKQICSERELEQDPLKRIILAKVNYALKAAYGYLKTKDKSNVRSRTGQQRT
jgi:hypothetical protein